MRDVQKAVKIHLLQIMILRDDTADKTDELIRVRNEVVRNADQTDLVVQFIHVLGAFVQIADRAEDIFDFRIDFVQQVPGFPFSLIADN